MVVHCSFSHSPTTGSVAIQCGVDGAVPVGLDRPADPFADLVDGVGAGERDRHHQEGEDEQDGECRGDRAVAADADKQPPVERPAGEGDDERGQHREQEAVEEIDAGGDDQHQQPARRRQRRNDGGPAAASTGRTGAAAVPVSGFLLPSNAHLSQTPMLRRAYALL